VVLVCISGDLIGFLTKTFASNARVLLASTIANGASFQQKRIGGLQAIDWS
jgi:hypothetical protein